MLAFAFVSAHGEERLLPEPPPASTDAIHLDFQADSAEYEDDLSLIRLTGSVLLRTSTWTVKARQLWLETDRRRAHADGDVLVEDGVTAVYGDGGELDFADETGFLHNPSAGHGDWRIHARSVRLGPARRLSYRGARFTSCSFDPKPHYHIRASRVSVVPQKRFTAWNARFYLGRVPVFYSPFFTKSLKPRSFLRIKVQPGYDRRNGGFLKGTLTTEHGPYTASKLYLDYFSAQGVGTGVEVQRQKGGDSRGGLYGYRIRETHNGRERWTVLGSGYQAFRSSFSAQGRLQVQSDADFNNDYARSAALRVTPELINNAAVVYRLPSVTTRLSYSRLDLASASRASFLKQRESSPRLDVQTVPLRLWRLPWLNVFTGFADNVYDKGKPFLEKSAGAGWEITRTFNLARGLSFTPKAGYQQAYYNRVDAVTVAGSTDTVQDAWVGRYAVSNNLRWSTPLGDWDLGHSYKRRLKANTMNADAQAVDRGVEENLVTLQDGFRPARRVYLRASSGYDFRVFRTYSVGFRERVQPLVAEVIYTPRHDLNFTLRDDYQLQAGNRSFLASALWGDETGTFLSGGAGYNLGQAQTYLLNAEFGLAPSSATWSVTGAVRSQAVTPGGVTRLSRFQPFEKELSVAKHWHDFFTRLMVRFRPGGVKEIFARIDLKLGRMPGPNAPKRDWEAEWFPDRRKGLEDRP